jgi:Arc/MetJ-type ribon-helix-helix transcriptional regulator
MSQGDAKSYSRDEKTTLHISSSLAERIKRRLKNSDFTSLDEYVSYILNQILDELEGQSQKSTDRVFSKEEQESVEERLRSLGYM